MAGRSALIDTVLSAFRSGMEGGGAPLRSMRSLRNIQRAGWFTGRAVPRAFVGGMRGLDWMVNQKKIALPIMGGLMLAGAAKGFGNVMLKDPVGFAWMTSGLNPGYQGYYQGRNPLGQPIGTYNQYGNSMMYQPRQLPSDPLMATGEIVLASFAMRHGR
jgi:hypothetical protein